MISIYASELAACIGLNKYRPIEDVARKIWSRTDPEGYTRALLRNEADDPEPIDNMLQELNLTERVGNIIENRNVESFSNDLVTLADDLGKKGIVLTDVSPGSESIEDSVRSFIFTERGKNFEDESLDRLEKQLNVTIRDRNRKFYKRYLEYQLDDDNQNDAEGTEPVVKKFLIGGKVDGITEDGRLVEVKNRQYRIFKDIPIYEKVQIHVYMFLTGITRCTVVQSYDGQDHPSQLIFDEEFWEDIKERCTRFVTKLDKLLMDADSQDALLSLGDF